MFHSRSLCHMRHFKILKLLLYFFEWNSTKLIKFALPKVFRRFNFIYAFVIKFTMVFVLYFYCLFYYLFLVILLKKKVCIYDFSFFFFGVLFFKFCFRLRLEGGNGMKWKEMKKIILEYSSIPLFGSFNGGNRKLIPLFGSLSRRKWNG